MSLICVYFITFPIVSDFMSDQFSLQEYSVQDDQTTTATTTEESNVC